MACAFVYTYLLHSAYISRTMEQPSYLEPVEIKFPECEEMR